MKHHFDTMIFLDNVIYKLVIMQNKPASILFHPSGYAEAVQGLAVALVVTVSVTRWIPLPVTHG